MADAVFWVGQDGNIYYGSGAAGSGVQNMGSASDYTYSNGSLRPVSPTSSNQAAQALADGPGAIINVSQIADPLAGSSAPSNPTGASHPALNQAAVDNTQRSIDQIPAILAQALAAENTDYGNTTSGYDTSETSTRGQYTDNSNTNQNNYDSNYMAAIHAGIKGLSGLFALLRGTGAAGGSADENVRDIVGGTTANDIKTGQVTRDQNQTALDQSLSGFLTDLKGKRQTAADTHTNNTASIQHDANTNLQDLYSKMAGYYGDAGNTGASNDWMARAGNLTPDIAAESGKTVSKYDNTPVVIHAPNLTAFAAPTQPSVVTKPDSGQVGSGIFSINPPTKKTQESAPAGA